METNKKVDADLIDLQEIWQAMWSFKYHIITFTAVFAIAAIFYALSLPDQYKAEALVAHAQDDDVSSLANMAGQLGGIASLAGFNLPSDSNDTLVNIERLQSKSFLYDFIDRYDLKVSLLAAKGWDKNSKKLLIDSAKYNVNTQEWVRVVADGDSIVPTNFEAYEALRDIFMVEQDKVTGLLTVSIEFFDPDLAKKWVDLLIRELNLQMRELEIAEKQKSIDFMSRQLKKTDVTEMQNVFYQIIEEQTKAMLLAEVQQDFVFKVIDGAIVPEKKSGPKRAVICIIGTMLGGILSILCALLVFYTKKYRRISD